jgi:hypothetical protein
MHYESHHPSLLVKKNSLFLLMSLHVTRIRTRLSLSAYIGTAIASIKPPNMKDDDNMCWSLTSDMDFTIKPTYFYNSNDSRDGNNHDPIFPLDWQWYGSSNIHALLWNVCHGKLLTNEERNPHRITSDGICMRCNFCDESIMHVIRDGELICVHHYVANPPFYILCGIFFINYIECNNVHSHSLLSLPSLYPLNSLLSLPSLYPLNSSHSLSSTHFPSFFFSP